MVDSGFRGGCAGGGEEAYNPVVIDFRRKFGIGVQRMKYTVATRPRRASNSQSLPVRSAGAEDASVDRNEVLSWWKVPSRTSG